MGETRSATTEWIRTQREVGEDGAGLSIAGLQSNALRVARAARGSGAATDWRAQLRRRLGIFACIYAIIFGLILIKFAIETLATGRLDQDALPMAVLLCLLIGAVWYLLIDRQPAAPHRLRAVELGLFGTLAAVMGYGQYWDYKSGWGEQWYGLGLGRDSPYDPMALPWAFLILCYGIFIPNSVRRCILVVGAMAACPIVIGVAAHAQDATPGGLMAAVPLVLPTAGWVLSAATVAVLGAYRINVLERSVRESRTLGQYQLVQRLGGGGMGEVYLAEHLLLRRPCAVKLIRREWAGDERMLRLFEREVRTTAGLTHPNTVEIYDYGLADDGTFYYAMEYLPGRSLQELVDSEGSLEPDRTIHLLTQICGALAEAHAVGLIHRDVKPGNILVCERGGIRDVAKLLDFGLVQGGPNPPTGGGPIVGESSIRGTPAYMSPEQAYGASLDGRSDLYSLGAVAYFLLTGRPPFVCESAMQTLQAQIHESPEPLTRLRADVPAELAATVMRCLAKSPDDRFPSAAALANALVSRRNSGRSPGQEAASV
jgi:serine/threonine-protein kinase